MKVRTRRLWLKVGWKVPDKTIKQSTIIKTLIDSIDNQTYTYPKSWRVAIQWRNSQFSEMKTAEFTQAMKESRKSSPGWDIAVRSYLENEL